MKILYLILTILLATVQSSSADTTFSGVCGLKNIVISSDGSIALTDWTQEASTKGAWYMNGTTTELDRSGNSADLTETSGTIPTSEDVPSGYASSTSRDFELGDSEWLEMADGGSTDINGTDPVTFAAWIKPESIDNTNGNTVISKHKESTDNRQFYFGIGPGSKIIMIWHSTGTFDFDEFTQIKSTTATMSAGSWYHIAAVCDIDTPADTKFYLNGEEVDITLDYSTATSIYNGEADFIIGADNEGSNRKFDGLIYEPIVIRAQLTDGDIANMYSDGINGKKGDHS